MGFDIQRVAAQDTTEIAIAVHGSLDARIVPILHRTIGRLELSGVGGVLLDLEQVHDMDAAGLRLVFDLHSRCVDADAHLRITPPQPPADDVFAHIYGELVTATVTESP